MNSLEDFILTYISEQTIIHPKDIKDKFQKKGYNMERITQAITDIDSEGLISTAQGKTESICLTREGKKAVKMGFAKYLEMKEKENELDSRIKKTTLWGNIFRNLWISEEIPVRTGEKCLTMKMSRETQRETRGSAWSFFRNMDFKTDALKIFRNIQKI